MDARSYGLGSWQQQPGQKGFDVSVTEEVSDTEFRSIVDACGRYAALAERTTYALVRRNRDRLLHLHDLFANVQRFGGAFREVDQRALTVTFMNELLNWLVSKRFYLETERNFLTSTYGAGSEQLSEHIRATSVAFDQFPGYRFMYKLRDYAQHGGVPLSGLNVQRSSSGETELIPYLSRQTLLASSFNWGAPVGALIAASDEVIPVLPLVLEAFDALESIERMAVLDRLNRIAEVLPILTEAISRVGDTDGHPAVFSTPNGDGELTWSTLPTPKSLEAVRHAAANGELPPRVAHPRARENLTAPQGAAARRAIAAIGALLLPNPDSAEHDLIVADILKSDRSPIPLISGLSDMGNLLLLIASQALGTSAEAMLGSLTPAPEEWPTRRSPDA